MKICKQCNIPKVLTAFGNEKGNKDVNKGKCLACVKLNAAAYYINNAEGIKKMVKVRSDTIPAEVKAGYRRGRYMLKMHKEKAQMKEYRESRP